MGVLDNNIIGSVDSKIRKQVYDTLVDQLVSMEFDRKTSQLIADSMLNGMTATHIIMTQETTVCCDGGYVVLAKITKEKCLIFNPKETAPHSIDIDDLYNVWNGEAILLIPRLYKYRDVKFGFKWFIPTILKYKIPLTEVLMAAFVMQLLALCSPLITQSVIDKVLVHNSLLLIIMRRYPS